MLFLQINFSFMSKSRNVVGGALLLGAIGTGIYAGKSCEGDDAQIGIVAKDRGVSPEVAGERAQVGKKVKAGFTILDGGVMQMELEAQPDIEELRRDANRASWLTLACTVDPDPEGMDACLRKHSINPDIAEKTIAEVGVRDVDADRIWALGIMDRARHRGNTIEKSEARLEEIHGITPELDGIADNVADINRAIEEMSIESATPYQRRDSLKKVASGYANLLGYVETSEDEDVAMKNVMTGLKMSPQGLAQNLDRVVEMLGGAQRNELAGRLMRFAALVRDNIE